jgi:hypothetical protein
MTLLRLYISHHKIEIAAYPFLESKYGISPSADVWIKKMWYISLEYYSPTKKKKTMSFSGEWMDLEIIMLSKISKTQRDEYHVFSHMQNLGLQEKTGHEHKRGTLCVWGRGTNKK